MGPRETRRRIKKQLRQQGGLWVVEGPGDVINLARAEITAVALMWNDTTPHQIQKLAQLAWQLCDGHLVPLFDLDDEGRQGMFRFLQKLSPHAYVRVGWTTNGGTSKWTGKQPEELTTEEMLEVKEGVTSTHV